MKRKTILNFIAQNFDELSKLNLKKMSIFLFGIDYSSSKYKDILFGEKCFVFDVKLPRIDEKIFDLNIMNNPLLEMSLGAEGINTISKEEFNDEIDPINNKLIKDYDFNFMHLIPIIKDNEHEGLIILYTMESNITKIQGINKLFNDLVEAYDLELDKRINELPILDNYYILLDNKGKYYLNSDEVDVETIKNHYSTSKCNLSFPYEDITCYYLLKEELNNLSNKIYHPINLDKLKLGTNFTLLILECDNPQHLIKYTNSFNLNVSIYDFEDNIYLLLIEGKNKSIPKSNFKGYEIKITAPKDITNKMNIRKIVSFIKEFRPIEFDINEYKNYINMLGTEKLKTDLNFNQKGRILNSLNDENVGYILNSVPEDFRFLDNKYQFENKLFNLMKRYADSEYQNVSFGIMSSSILKRRNKEIIKKYTNNGININLIIHYDGSESKEELIEELIYLKINNIPFYYDSSIFLKLDLIDLTSIPKGIYLRKEECMALENTKEGFVNIIMTYFFNENYQILFEKTGNDVKDNNYRNENILFVERLIK